MSNLSNDHSEEEDKGSEGQERDAAAMVRWRQLSEGDGVTTTTSTQELDKPEAQFQS
jgi:hypothetical protein